MDPVQPNSASAPALIYNQGDTGESMVPTKLIDGYNEKRWAVCPRPTESTSVPEWFPSEEAASSYRDEVLVPAVIGGALLPPRTERLPDEWIEVVKRDTAAVGPFCPITIIVGRRTPVRVNEVPRVTSFGMTWIILERADGGEWPLLVDENGNELSSGIGAYLVGADLPSMPPLPFPPGYRRSRRRRTEPVDIVPIKWLFELAGPPYVGKNFREYLPPDEFVVPVTSCPTIEEMTAEVGKLMTNDSPEITCELGDDWRFETIEREAMALPEYGLKYRAIKGHEHQLALIAHALEAALLRHHAVLTSEAVSAFWTSWSVWNHLEKWSDKISDELSRRDPAHEHRSRMSHALQHQAWSFARSVLAWRETVVPCSTEVQDDIGCAEVSPPPNEPAAMASDAASDTTAGLSRVTAKSLCASNLDALRRESKLSNRRLARLIGNHDHKAIADHCAGRRAPEDRTVAEYAQAFTRCLKREITVAQIRETDMTGRTTDSIA